MIKKLIDIYYEIPIKFIDVNFHSALEIANEYGLYAYDAYFLECAKKFDFPFLTLDEKLKRISIKLGIKTLEV